MSSADGSHWTLIEKTPIGGDDNDLFRGVTYGNGRFVAVGGSTVALTQISTDGMNWIDGGAGTAWLGGVAWNGKAFVAAGGNGLRVRSLDNGATWTDPAGSQAKHYRAVAFGGGQVVAVGHTYDKSGPNGTDVGVIASTADGLQWTERRAAGETFGSIAYGNGIFVPLRDATAGHSTYGAGRYLLDTVKGADLGREGDAWVVDLNFSYNPSCAYDPNWACPLAPPGNRLDIEVPVGELSPTGG